MDGRRIVVVEANEVPRRLIEELASAGRVPFLAAMIEDGTLVESTVTETLPRELYPSQTWASMNSGVPFEDHQIYWYGDPKPDRYPMYWQTAARAGRSVGLVNTLHSSPLARQCADGDFRFVIPDCFSVDDDTIPSHYQRFQRVNRSLTGANSRRAGLRPRPADLVDMARSVPQLGLQAESVAHLIRLVAGAAVRRTPTERLRCGQFLLHQNLFMNLLDRHRPDLAVLFTNHVAAAMHRYWYALHPDDFGHQHYDARWIARYRDEIPYALGLLDRFLERLHRWCFEHDRTLVIASSMGQGPSAILRSDVTHEAVVVDVPPFLRAMDIDHVVTEMGSMAPQLTLGCATAAVAADVASRLADADVGQVFWDVDGADAVVTLTCNIEVVDPETIRIGGARRQAESAGIKVYAVDDHSSGRHTAHGILGVANSPTFKPPFDDNVDYLEFAPAMLQHLGVPPVEHQRMPGFEI
ncbi:MAG: hypothetical protein ACR2QK_20055 [Acidimicrobiales bacterium]